MYISNNKSNLNFVLYDVLISSIITTRMELAAIDKSINYDKNGASTHSQKVLISHYTRVIGNMYKDIFYLELY
jgi:hypothetical protein